MATLDAFPEAHQPLGRQANDSLMLVAQALCLVVPLAVWFAPFDIDPKSKHVLAIVGFMVTARPSTTR